MGEGWNQCSAVRSKHHRNRLDECARSVQGFDQRKRDGLRGWDDLRQKLDHELDAIALPEAGDAGVAAEADAQAPQQDGVPDEAQEP